MRTFRVERWVNSGPLSADLVSGPAVPVDFGSNTCVNWIRTSPWVKAWNREYADRGLVVGLHAPEVELGKLDFHSSDRVTICVPGHSKEEIT